MFDEQEDDEARELLLDVADSDSYLAGDGGSAPPKIRVRGLQRRAEATGEEILRGVHLDVPRGVVMGVIGPSGSGKSTLLRALNRLWEPAPGAVFLDGADVCGLDVRALRRRVGMLFQQPAMFDGTYVTSFFFLCQTAAFSATRTKCTNTWTVRSGTHAYD